MSRYHNGDISRFLQCVQAGLEAKVLRPALRYGSTRIAAASIGRMRDAKGEPMRRRKDDSGPLRIVTGEYARGIRGNAVGSIERITVEGGRATMQKGVDLAVLPQGYNEFDTRFATLEPGMLAEGPRIARHVRKLANKHTQDCLSAL